MNVHTLQLISLVFCSMAMGIFMATNELTGAFFPAFIVGWNLYELSRQRP